MQEDEGQAAILALTVTAALVSLAAIFAQLGTGAGGGRPSDGAPAVRGPDHLAVWAFIHTMFALHYAHEYYDRTAGGMVFPGEEREPDYWDFVYSPSSSA